MSNHDMNVDGEGRPDELTRNFSNLQQDLKDLSQFLMGESEVSPNHENRENNSAKDRSLLALSPSQFRVSCDREAHERLRHSSGSLNKTLSEDLKTLYRRKSRKSRRASKKHTDLEKVQEMIEILKGKEESLNEALKEKTVLVERLSKLQEEVQQARDQSKKETEAKYEPIINEKDKFIKHLMNKVEHSLTSLEFVETTRQTTQAALDEKKQVVKELQQKLKETENRLEMVARRLGKYEGEAEFISKGTNDCQDKLNIETSLELPTKITFRNERPTQDIERLIVNEEHTHLEMEDYIQKCVSTEDTSDERNGSASRTTNKRVKNNAYDTHSDSTAYNENNNRDNGFENENQELLESLELHQKEDTSTNNFYGKRNTSTLFEQDKKELSKNVQNGQTSNEESSSSKTSTNYQSTKTKDTNGLCSTSSVPSISVNFETFRDNLLRCAELAKMLQREIGERSVRLSSNYVGCAPYW